MPTSSTRSSSTRTAASSAATTAARRGRSMSETNPRGIYYSQVRIDPNNDQRVWVHGAQMYYSEDGGKTFKTNLVQKIHGDYHAMWIDPRDSNHMIAGSDGGIYFTHDRGRTLGLPQQRRRSASSTRSVSTCRGRTASAAACRTTTSGADRRPRSTRAASPTPTGSRSAAATASTRRSIRPIRTPSTPSRRTATCCGAISRRTSRARSGRRPPKGSGCASSGTRRSSSPRSTTRRSTTAATISSNRPTAATPGRGSAAI